MHKINVDAKQSRNFEHCVHYQSWNHQYASSVHQFGFTCLREFASGDSSSYPSPEAS